MSGQGKYWCFTYNLEEQDVLEDNAPLEYDPETMSV